MHLFISYLTYFYLFVLSILPINSWSHGFQGQPSSFIPYKAVTDTERTVSSLLFRNLVNVDPFTGEVEYDLLESYEIKQNGLVYELKLKEKQYWHDGIEITSDDLLYTASLSTNLREVSSDKIDNYKVRFILPNAYSPFISVLNIPVIPQHLQDHNNNLTPIGSGDFRAIRVKKDRAAVEDLVLVSLNRNLPYQKIIFKFYENDDDLRVALKLKEVESILFNKSENFEGYNKKQYTFFGRSYLLVFDTQKEYLNNDNRRKIASAINYDLLLKEQEYEDAIRPHGVFSNTWADSESFEQIDYDPNILLDIKDTLLMIIPNVNEARIIANQIKKDLGVKGVNVEIKPLSTIDYVINIRKYDYDLVLLAQEYGVDPDRFIFWHSTQNTTGLNFSNFSTLRIDRSLEEAREEQDIEKRKGHYNIFQSVFSEEVLATYLVHPSKYFYFSNQIETIPDQRFFYPWQIFNNFSKWKKASPKII